MTSPSELLEAQRASVVAPAGCGKTELIADAIAVAPLEQRHLVLTHTNAGVGALRDRLRRKRVAPARFQVDTIAGFCLRYGAAYPTISGLQDSLNPSGGAWEAVYPAADRLLATDVGMAIAAASYDGVFVDEYQDCSPEQHRIVLALARRLPVRVVGDPLQTIFGFRGPSIEWSTVEADFPPIEPLSTPWRWANTNPALGDWLLGIREALSNSAPIAVMADAPVTWLTHTGVQAHLMDLAKTRQSAVAIRKWEADTHALAGELEGRYNAIETVDCKDLANLAHELDGDDRRAAVRSLLDLFRRSSVGMNDILTEAIERLDRRERVDRDQWPELFAQLARVFHERDPEAVRYAVDEVQRHKEVRVFRRELLEEVAYALMAIKAEECASFGEAAWFVRDQARRNGRRPDPRIVSRTLLVKGLEFDHVVIPNPMELSANDLYVALTRGSRSVAVVRDDGEPDVINYAGALRD